MQNIKKWGGHGGKPIQEVEIKEVISEEKIIGVEIMQEVVIKEKIFEEVIFSETLENLKTSRKHSPKVNERTVQSAKNANSSTNSQINRRAATGILRSSDFAKS